MVAFVWLEEGMQTKEEWRYVATDYGGPSGMDIGTVLMLSLFVENLDYTSHTQVCLLCTVMSGNNITKFLIGVEVFYNRYFGAGTGPILYTYLYCDGTELRLTDCRTSSSFVFWASHSNDAGVRCQRPATASKQYYCFAHPFIHLKIFSSSQLLER